MAVGDGIGVVVSSATAVAVISATTVARMSGVGVAAALVADSGVGSNGIGVPV